MNLKDKVALVTGGASGLGHATVEDFVSKEFSYLGVLGTVDGRVLNPFTFFVSRKEKRKHNNVWLSLWITFYL